MQCKTEYALGIPLLLTPFTTYPTPSQEHCFITASLFVGLIVLPRKLLGQVSDHCNGYFSLLKSARRGIAL